MTARRDFAKLAEHYARDVVAGKVPACRYVKLACQRHLDDLKASRKKAYPYVFDAAAANKVCRFVELMPHVKGKWARDRERLHLERWQAFILACVFGWKRKRDGLRRFRRTYKEIARKNAKSTLTAAVGHYMLVEDSEEGAEVYSGATTEKQAWEVFGPARLMADKTLEYQEHYGVSVGAKNLHVLATASKFEPIIGKPGDGASPSFSITDEYHEHDSSDQYDTMVTGMGAREQPIAWVITTAGDDTAGPCYALRQQVVEMLEGKVEHDDLFGIIYTIDDGVDWTSEVALRMANPNMGVSVFEDFLFREQRRAVVDPREQAKFKTKHLNVWVTAAAPYFNAELWARLADPSLSIEQFRSEECVVGVDLAAKLDLCAVIKLFRREVASPAGERICRPCRGRGDNPECACGGTGRVQFAGGMEWHFFAFANCYIPDSRAKDPERRHYGEWAEKGHLIATPGDITDYDYIEADLKDDAARHAILQLGADPHNATQLLTHLQGFLGADRVVEVPQTVLSLSEPMKEVQALIVDGRLHHDGNPVLSWAIGNVTAQEDRNANVFPRKEREEKKIDPAVALIIAMGRALAAPQRKVPRVLVLADAPQSSGSDPDGHTAAAPDAEEEFNEWET